MITFSQLGTLPWGRLGNQLFCIAATIGIAHRNDQPFVLPPWSYSRFFANPLPTGQVPGACPYEQSSFAYQPVDLPTGDWDLRGSFQSERFFVDAAELIRHYFTPAPNLLADLQTRYGALLAQQPVSLHVRRGDYIRHRAAFPPQPLAYYQTAIRKFPTDTRFLVFSDDIAWCRRQFTGDQFTFVEGESDIKDLFLMSLCRHHILSNSSFSWWGAWLNPLPDKLVYCPAYWFGPATSPRPQHYTRDLYATGFIPLIPDNVDPRRKDLIYLFAYPFYSFYMSALTIGVKVFRRLGLYPTPPH